MPHGHGERERGERKKRTRAPMGTLKLISNKKRGDRKNH